MAWEDFIAKTVFLVKDLVSHHKKVLRPHSPGKKLQKARLSRPGVIQGRLEEMSMTDLLAVARNGARKVPAGWLVRHDGEQGELFFFLRPGNAATRQIGGIEGDDRGLQSHFVDRRRIRKLDFNAASASSRTTTTTAAPLDC